MHKLVAGGFRTNADRAARMGLKPAPAIKGYFFDKEKADGVILHNLKGGMPRYLGLFIETVEKCDLKCWFCYSRSGKKPERAISLDDMKRAVDIAAGYGIESVIVAGRGEPLMDEGTMPLVRHVSEKGLSFVLFTNNTLLTTEMAKELHALNTTVIAKMGSLDPDEQDSIVGVSGAHRRIWKGLGILTEAGFSQPRFAIDTTITRGRLGEIEDIWRYLRGRSAIPFFEPLIASGRALEYPERLRKELLSRKEVMELYQRLRQIDEQEFGYTWIINQTMRVPCSEECSRHPTMLTLRHNGDVSTCVNSLDEVAGNIFQKSLDDIIENSPVLKKIREGCAACVSRYCRAGD